MEKCVAFDKGKVRGEDKRLIWVQPHVFSTTQNGNLKFKDFH